jgi:hypothetical protein
VYGSTRSSASRLLAGEIEWFGDSEDAKVEGEITFGGSFWSRRENWQADKLFKQTDVSQCLSGFGHSHDGDAPYGNDGDARNGQASPSQSHVSSFKGSLKNLFNNMRGSFTRNSLR